MLRTLRKDSQTLKIAMTVFVRSSSGAKSDVAISSQKTQFVSYAELVTTYLS